MTEKDITLIMNGTVLCDSRIIADKFEKPHDYVMKRIRQLEKRLVLTKVGTTRNESIIDHKTRNYRGRDFKYCLLNKKAFALLAMSFTGDRAFEWQVKFYDAFSAMETIISNKSDSGWSQIRKDSKDTRLEFTGCIADFVKYCTDQGSKSAFRYYGNLTKMEYVALRFLEYKEKVPSNFRDTLDRMQLHMIVMAEHVANETIKQGMTDKLHYKEIFILSKQAVIKYADTVLFDQKKIPNDS